MKDLIHQLEEIGRLAQSSFGVLGGDVRQFEEQFLFDDESGSGDLTRSSSSTAQSSVFDSM